MLWVYSDKNENLSLEKIKTLNYRYIICLLLVFHFLPAYSSPSENGPNDSVVNYTSTQSILKFKIGETLIPVSIIKFGKPDGLVCVNLHDNEQASVNAAKELLAKRGGLLISLENNKKRNIQFKLNGYNYSFDPNRIFSKEGIIQTLNECSHMNTKAAEAIERFSHFILSFLPDSSYCVVALHNNYDGNYCIYSYSHGSSLEKNAKNIYINKTQDPDNIILTTDSLLFNNMSANGYNSILQDNEKAKKDGSLSVYFGEQCKRYINIETEQGKKEQYKEMLQKLLIILDAERSSNQIINN